MVVPHRPKNTAPLTSATFDELGVPAQLTTVLARQGVVSPFPIQAATLPDALAGRDVLGRGATGSGKSLAFLIPVVARLSGSGRTAPRRPRALVLAPTRELASQLNATLAPLAAAAGLRHHTVFGGVASGPQVKAFDRGVDILVACPGRLNDHLASGAVSLDAVEITVLDEADHMADLGFLRDVRRILDRTPRGTQRLLFSATLDAGVDVLVDRYLDHPVVHHVEQPSASTHQIEHRIVEVDADSRVRTITQLAAAPGRVVVFTRTRRGAKRLARQLTVGGVPSVELHGDLGQSARRRNLIAFREGEVKTLVATDIAARGIHVDDVELVIHADPPADHKSYLHRSGRTGRAGATGTVVTIALASQLADVQAMARKASVSADLVAPSGRPRGTAPREGRTSSPARSRRTAVGGQSPRRRSRTSDDAIHQRGHSAAAFSAARRSR